MGDIHHYAWRARHRNQTLYINRRDGERFGNWTHEQCAVGGPSALLVHLHIVPGRWQLCIAGRRTCAQQHGVGACRATCREPGLCAALSVPAACCVPEGADQNRRGRHARLVGCAGVRTAVQEPDAEQANCLWKARSAIRTARQWCSAWHAPPIRPRELACSRALSTGACCRGRRAWRRTPTWT